MTTPTEDLAQLIADAIAAKPAAAKPTLQTPRLGGLNVTGVWTGSGASGLLLEPNSTHCMRTFATDVIKNHQAMAPIEDRCKKGLRDSPELLFCMPDEPNAGTIVSSIRALEDHIILCGMEGAFTILTATSSNVTSVNMLQSPGRITTEIVDAWCQASLTDGIPKFDTTNNSIDKHAICPHDRTNMLWSADAVLNSCTETLRQDLKLVIPPQDRTGPKVLMTIFEKLYRPSLANNKALLDKLDKMDIRKYAGENVTLFVQDAVKIVRELQMNYMSDDAMPELTMTALSGLTKSSDHLLRHTVREQRLACDINGFGFAPSQARPDALSALQKVDAMYRVLINTKDYSPAQSASEDSKLRAMVASAIDAKLTQDRTAGGTHGGAGGPPRACFDCGALDHFRGSPACTKSKTAPTGSPPPASNTNPDTRKSGHGLPDDLLSQAKDLAKAKLLTMPARENIPDTAEFSILIGDKTVGKYCRHCGRFVYGSSQHTTKEHKGRQRFPYQEAAAAPAAAAATASVATLLPAVPSVSFSLVAAVPPVQEPPSLDLASVPQISTDMFLNRQANYDLGHTPTIDAHLAMALEDDDEEYFLAVLGKAYGG
jgi:hypothetical protein